jgi:hypothetical protein
VYIPDRQQQNKKGKVESSRVRTGNPGTTREPLHCSMFRHADNKLACGKPDSVPKYKTIKSMRSATSARYDNRDFFTQVRCPEGQVVKDTFWCLLEIVIAIVHVTKTNIRVEHAVHPAGWLFFFRT